MRIHSWVILVGTFFATVPAYSHQLSTAYASMEINSQGLFTGELQVRFYDLEQAVGVDNNGDGELLWGELQSNKAIVQQYFSERFQLRRGDFPCSLAISEEWKIDTHYNESYLVVPMRAQCSLAGEIVFRYEAFFDEDSEHKLLLRLGSNTAESSRVLSDDQRQMTWSVSAGDGWKTFFEFTYQGMVHIWIGIDHILFLLSLLLVSVLIFRNGRWSANDDLRKVLASTAWIVTAFTLAHSITLSATALGLIHFPSKWVEVCIAFSVMFVALNNIYPLVARLGWLAFAFGLLHGMGFAGVLGELGLPADQQFLTVLAFNLGVEVGQMAIVMLLLPLFIFLRHKLWYSRYAVTGVSIIVVLISLKWVFERWLA